MGNLTGSGDNLSWSGGRFATMKKRAVLIVAAVAALAYYWIRPGVSLALQIVTSEPAMNAIVASYPAPTIQRVLVLPGYRKQTELIDHEPIETFRRNPGTDTILIVGRHLKSFVAADSRAATVTTIGTHSFTRPQWDAFTDAVVAFEVDHSILPGPPDQAIDITVSRDGESSRPFVLTGAEVSRQLEVARGTSPAVVDAIPLGYALNESHAREMHVLFVIAGWPAEGVTFSPKLDPCSYEVDDKLLECRRYYLFDGLNLMLWSVGTGLPDHRASFVLNGVASPPLTFDTRESERYCEEVLAVVGAYHQKRMGKKRASETGQTLLAQSKDGSLPALGINIGLTLMSLLLMRPWRHSGFGRWVLSFVIPVVLQALGGVVVGLVLQGRDFLAPVIGAMLIVMSLSQALFPLAQAIVVAILLTLATRSTRESTG